MVFVALTGAGARGDDTATPPPPPPPPPDGVTPTVLPDETQFCDPLEGADVDAKIQPAVSEPIVRAPCPMSPTPQYARLYGTACLPCPNGGVCDGSWQINLSYGFWRWTELDMAELRQAYDLVAQRELHWLYETLYECVPRRQCPNDGGGAEAPVCRQGHKPDSLLCSTCLAEHAMSDRECYGCGAFSVNLMLSAVILTVAAAFVAALSFTTSTDNIKGRRSLGVVLLKQLIGLVQMSGAASGGSEIEWPSVVDTLYSLLRRGVSFHKGVSPVTCTYPTSYYVRYLIVMSTPIVASAVVLAVGVVLQIRSGVLLQRKEKADFERRMREYGVEDKGVFNFVSGRSSTLPSEEQREARHANWFERLTHLLGVQETDDPLVAGGGAAARRDSLGALQSRVRAERERRQEADAARFFHIPQFPDLAVHVESEELLVKVSRPPENEVTLKPHGGDLVTFVPEAFTFSPEATEVQFSVCSKAPGRHVIDWKLIGTDRKSYPLPDPACIFIFAEWRTSVLDKVCTSLLVILFLCYPMLFQTMASMVRCDTIGPDGRSFLEVDREIECHTAGWYAFQFVNLSAFGLYGVLIPGLLFAYLQSNQGFLEDFSVRCKVGFIFRGFRRECWYWEFVVTLRKILIIAVGTFCRTVYFKLYMSMWIFSLSLILNHAVQPWSWKGHFVAESFILTCLMVSMSLGIVYFTKDPSELAKSMAQVALVVLIIGMIVGLMLCYAWLWSELFVKEGLHRRLQQRLIGMLDEDGDGNLTMNDVREMVKRKLLPACCRRKQAEDGDEVDEELQARAAQEAAWKEEVALRKKAQNEKDGALEAEEDGEDDGTARQHWGAIRRYVNLAGAVRAFRDRTEGQQPGKRAALRAEAARAVGRSIIGRVGGMAAVGPAMLRGDTYMAAQMTAEEDEDGSAGLDLGDSGDSDIDDERLEAVGAARDRVRHTGSWRGAKPGEPTILPSAPPRFGWCSVPDWMDGALCKHGGGYLRQPHWSCCGQFVYVSDCVGEGAVAEAKRKRSLWYDVNAAPVKESGPVQQASRRRSSFPSLRRSVGEAVTADVAAVLSFDFDVVLSHCPVLIGMLESSVPGGLDAVRRTWPAVTPPVREMIGREYVLKCFTSVVRRRSSVAGGLSPALSPSQIPPPLFAEDESSAAATGEGSERAESTEPASRGEVSDPGRGQRHANPLQDLDLGEDEAGGEGGNPLQGLQLMVGEAGSAPPAAPLPTPIIVTGRRRSQRSSSVPRFVLPSEASMLPPLPTTSSLPPHAAASERPPTLLSPATTATAWPNPLSEVLEAEWGDDDEAPAVQRAANPLLELDAGSTSAGTPPTADPNPLADFGSGDGDGAGDLPQDTGNPLAAFGADDGTAQDEENPLDGLRHLTGGSSSTEFDYDY
eukprot:TRINITY_DN11661_c0_g3_i2.p1 TRINITY_DN11661_c0_g3~~TRINITY_DN11661_c0_g3_i2.p1  ORF type:complete len:1388 (+),score=494.22 TRINITY_DN11661_c0_g3_i2:2869-7032(+)